MRKILAFAACVIGLSWAGMASAQVCQMSWFNYGYTPTSAQWQSCWNSKQNNLTYTPVNKAGDTMFGPLTTFASSTLAAGFTVPPGTAPASPNNGDIWTTSAGLYAQINGSTIGPYGTGGVASVGLALPGIFTVSGSPVTVSGTLTGTLNTQSPNLVWAGPTSGAAATPTFRALVGADMPNPSATTLGGIQSIVGTAHVWINAISTAGIPSTARPASTDLSDLPIPVSSGGTAASSASGTALDNITGFSSTGFVVRAGAGAYSFTSAANGITYANIAKSTTNTVSGNFTGGTANRADNAMPSCSTVASYLNYTSGTGIGCGSPQFAEFTYQTTSGTAGGETIASTTWTKRNLNTTLQNAITGLTGPTSNALSLPAGTYQFRITTTAANIAAVDCASRLRDTTTPATLAVSTQSQGNPANPLLLATVILSGTKTVELDTYCTTSAASPTALSSGEVEVWTDWQIRRIG